MERVLGFGGFFFKARDPKALAAWYEEALGINRTPTSYHQEAWEPQGGSCAFEPFPENTRMFPNTRYMLNFRVKDLHAMAEQLRKHGTEVHLDPEIYPNGLFATLEDPEGNPIQLWEEHKS